jgi:hypothetical protein
LFYAVLCFNIALMPIRIRILPLLLYMLENRRSLLLLLTAVPIYLSRQRNRCHNFQDFLAVQCTKIFWKKYNLASSQMAKMDQGPDRQALDADPDSIPDPQHWL